MSCRCHIANPSVPAPAGLHFVEIPSKIFCSFEILRWQNLWGNQIPAPSIFSVIFAPCRQLSRVALQAPLHVQTSAQLVCVRYTSLAERNEISTRSYLKPAGVCAVLSPLVSISELCKLHVSRVMVSNWVLYRHMLLFALIFPSKYVCRRLAPRKRNKYGTTCSFPFLGRFIPVCAFLR